MLEIKDLHVQFHTSDHEAVRGIDLTVQDGEIMGLVGESGSGKTVTAMMVSGLLRPEQSDFRGRILLDGEDLLHAGGQRIRAIQGKDICVVFQEPMSAMDPTMRIGKQVEECLRVHTDLSAQERRQRALQALRDVELPDPEGVYRKYPHELSGGMLQRVMIAAAIVARPRLLLADEPTTALDVTIQAQILALLKRLNREMGMSIRPSFRETVVEPAGDSCLCIVFSDAMNFSMGSRPSILGDLERHVEQAYGKSIYFKARLRENGERLDTRYITDEELRENIHMDITIED